MIKKKSWTAGHWYHGRDQILPEAFVRYETLL